MDPLFIFIALAALGCGIGIGSPGLDGKEFGIPVTTPAFPKYSTVVLVITI